MNKPLAAGLTVLALTMTLPPAFAGKVSPGTTGNDRIVGNAKANRIMSLGGRDRVTALGIDQRGKGQ